MNILIVMSAVLCCMKTTRLHICFRKSEDEIELKWITQADYDRQGKIVRYTLGLFIGFRCSDIQQGLTHILMKGWRKILWEYIFPLSQDNYLLHHDNDGLLIGFEDLDSEYWKGHIFEIISSKRRKIWKEYDVVARLPYTTHKQQNNAKAL